MKATGLFLATIFIASLFSGAAADDVVLDCDNLYRAMLTNVMLAYYDPDFQLSSINLDTYFIRQYVNIMCSYLGEFSQLPESSNERVAPIRNKKDEVNKLSFAETSQDPVTEADVIHMMTFDLLFINSCHLTSYVSVCADYCRITLREFLFPYNPFKNLGGVDDASDRSLYLYDQANFQFNAAYAELQCDF